MKTLLKLILVLSVVHLLAAAGFVGWLYQSGRIDSERLERMRAIFKPTIAEEVAAKQKLDEDVAKGALESAETARLRELPMASDEFIASSNRFEDRATLAMRTLDEQRRRMHEELRTREDGVTVRESALDKRQADWEASIAAELERETAEQFRKAVRLLEAAPSKQAREWILELVNTDRAEKAVAYLDAMNPAKSAGVLKALKGEGESKVATDLLERLRMLGLESEAGAERTHDAKPADSSAKSASRAASATPSAGAGTAARSLAGTPAGRATGPVSNGEVSLPGSAGGGSPVAAGGGSSTGLNSGPSGAQQARGPSGGKH